MQFETKIDYEPAHTIIYDPQNGNLQISFLQVYDRDEALKLYEYFVYEPMKIKIKIYYNAIDIVSILQAMEEKGVAGR